MSLQRLAGGLLRVVHVPKTIDGDLDLPDMITLAARPRDVGVHIVKDIMTDAKTTGRWYFIVTAGGRAARHLALGIGKSAGCTLTVIAEEFRTKTVPLSGMVDTRRRWGPSSSAARGGRDDGVAILAEGLIEKLDPAELAELPEIERDIHGNLRLAEVSFGDLIKRRVQARLSELGRRSPSCRRRTWATSALRRSDPFDMEYTARPRLLRHQVFAAGGGRDGDDPARRVQADPIQRKNARRQHDTTKVRMVDTETESYKDRAPLHDSTAARRFQQRGRRGPLRGGGRAHTSAFP
ncbi:MAG: hypothetical protein R3B07_24525 [Polyangiaceae bacterium]